MKRNRAVEIAELFNGNERSGYWNRAKAAKHIGDLLSHPTQDFQAAVG